MKVALINPSHLYLKQPHSQAPLGLMYIAAVLEEAGHEPIFVNLTGMTTDEGLKAIPEADLYGITGTIVDIGNINKLIVGLKTQFTAPVVVGGPCSVVPDALVGADSVVRGEGEVIIFEVIKDVEANRLKPHYIGKVVGKLDTLPLPARHLLGSLGGNIFVNNKKYKGEQSTVITSSRGCPYRCAFCSSPGFWSNKVRFHSPERVRDEVKHVIDTYGVYQFRFSDDSFTANPERAKRIADLLRPLDVMWRVSVRVNPHDMEMLERMRAGGCREVSFGVESFDQRVLDHLNKKTTVQDNMEAIRNAHNAGMVVRVLFMVGTPGQQSDTIDINIQRIEELSGYIGSVACTAYMPLPGSDIWNSPEKYGVIITDREYAGYNFYLFGPKGVREMPVAISHLNRDDQEVSEESLRFRDYLVRKGIANEG